jgi:lipoate-protein ligase A
VAAGDGELFVGLFYSRRPWFVLGIEDARTPEAGQRRIPQAVVRLARRDSGSDRS